MKTRNGVYPSASDGISFNIRQKRHRRDCNNGGSSINRPTKMAKRFCGFDALHDDLVISIIAAVSSTASSPADLVNTMLTCRRFCAAATHPQVLASASISALAVRSSRWSDGASRFLKQCADAGNAEACYTLGMVRFYCLKNRGGGASLMAKAAMASHAAALHSLAVIQFNGSGGSRRDKDLKAGVALCARAASLGHVDAMRELGHCLQDGYGIAKNVAEGRRLLLEANTREAAAAVAQSPRHFFEAALQITRSGGAMSCLHHHLHYYSAMGAAAAAAAAAAARSKPLPKPSTAAAVVLPAAAGRTTATTMVSPLFSSADGSQATQQQPQQQERAQQQPVECIPEVLNLLQAGGCSLLSDFGCNVPPPKLHAANRFLVDWFGASPPAAGLRLCSHANCGRPETRKHEFRRCSACGSVNYCSRACQALDWKIRHKFGCRPVDWEARDDPMEDDEDDEQQQDHQEQQEPQQQQQQHQDDEMVTMQL